jgi:hypothetical protein
MTKRIMSEVFINANRTVCRRTIRRGSFRGAFAVTARFNDAPDAGALTAALDDLVRDTNIAGGEIWVALDPAGMPVSAEEKMRGGDKKIKACLMVDTLHPSNAEALGKQLSARFPGAEVGVFRVLSQIGRSDL